jgi:anti-anti-sigma factor
MSPDQAAAPIRGFTLETHALEDGIVIHCRGQLTSEHSTALKTHVTGVFVETKRVVLDLRDLHRMDSSGLGAIVGLYVSARKKNCEFLVVNYNSAIRDLFGVTNVLAMFEDCGRTGMRMP